MANLSNINNKFIVTDGGQTLVNQTVAGFNPDADDLIVGNLSGNTGITIASGPNAGNYGSIYFADAAGSSTASKAGYIRYEQNTSEMTIGINAVEKIAIALNGDTTFAGNVKLTDEKILGLRNATNDYAIQYRDLDFRLIGSADGTTQRKFSFGYYTSDNPAGTWNGKVYINSYSGDVGIGTASPQRPLHVNGTEGVARFTSTASGNNGFEVGIGTASQAFLWQSESQFMQFATNNVERMRIDSSGNVGIGNTSPIDFLSWQRQLVVGSGSADAGITIYHGSGGGNQGAIVFADGNTGTDRYRGSISYNGADEMKFFTSTIERMRIDSSGQVQVRNGAGGGAELLLYNTDGSLTDQQIIGTLGFYKSDGSGSGAGISSSIIVRSDSPNGGNSSMSFNTDGGAGQQNEERMRIDSSGNVGIGKYPTDKTLELYSAGNTALRIQNSTTGSGSNDGLLIETSISNGDVLIWNYESAALRFGTAGSERMRITSAGQVIIGRTNDFGSLGFKFQVDFSGLTTGILVTSDATASKTALTMRDKNTSAVAGTITFDGSAAQYNTTSDYRLKENVVGMTGALDRVNQLKPSRFNFIADADKTVDGFLAHEVQEIVPEAITGEKDAVDEDGNPIYQGIDQSKLVPLLVGAIKELEARVKELENK